MNALPSVAERLSFYRDLIASFTTGRLSADDFEQRYLTAFKGEQIRFPEPVFNTLDELFANVDAYCPNAAIRDDNDIDADELQRRALLALDRLAVTCD